METSATADLHNTNGETPQSRFEPTVCLAEWWLTKAEDDRQVTILAVAGNTGGGKQHRRFVSSLPILKRHDAFNLETTDGKYVIIKSLMNKARSEENGFPSHACKHFVFGFPSFWKECTANYMVKETHCHQPHIGSSNNGLESQDTTDANSIQKSMKTKSSAYKLLQKYESAITGAEKISNTVNFTTLDMPVSSVSNTMKSIPTSDSVEKINILAVTAMNMENSIVHESGVRSPSTCHLYYSPQKVKVSRSKEMLGHTKTRARTCSASRLEIKQKNSQAPVMQSGREKIRSNSVSLSLRSVVVAELVCEESELGDRNNLHVEDTRLNESNGKMNSSEIDAGSAGQIPETSNLENGLSSVKTRGAKQKAKNKAISSIRKPITADDSECNDRVDSVQLDAGSVEHSPETSNPKNGLKMIKTRADKQEDKNKTMLSHTKTRARTRSTSRLVIKQKNCQAPVMPSGGDKIKSNSVSLSLLSDVTEVVCGESELGGRNNLHVEDTRLNESSDKINTVCTASGGQESHFGISIVEDCTTLDMPVRSMSIPKKSLPTSRSGERINTLAVIAKNLEDSVVRKSGVRSPSTCHLNDSRLNESNVEINSSELDTGSSKQIPEASNPENSLKRIKTRGAKQKDKNKATPSTPSNTEKSVRMVKTTGLEQKAKNKTTRSLSKPVTDRTSLSEDAEASYLNAGRKLALETPKGKKEKVFIDSPQPSSFKRSRSGRLLMPTLEFWRNQIPIYNADRSVAGIEEDMELEQMKKGSRPTARKKTRQLL